MNVAETLNCLSLEELALLAWRMRWKQQARPKQFIDFSKVTQNTIFISAGRGFGKTQAATNWIAWELCNDPGAFGHVIGATHNDVRYTVFEGASGVLRQVPKELIKEGGYNSSDLVLEFYNGAILRGFSAEKPDRLRGPQCKYLLAEELASWQRDRETWEQAKFGHRLGERSLAVITSTPKPKDLVRELMNSPDVIQITGHTVENAENLSPSFLTDMKRLEGTRLGRQELAGELLDAEELGVVKRSQWKAWDKPLPAFEIIVMSLDTAMTEESVNVKKQRSDYSACTVWGGFRERPVRSDGSIDYEAKPHPKIMLLDAWQERLGFPELLVKVKREKENRYGAEGAVVQPLYGAVKYESTRGRKPDIILIEDKASGISLRQMLNRDGIPVVPYNPGKADKYLRLNLVAPLFVGGYVHAVKSRERPQEFMTWAEPVIGQVCSYCGEGSIEHDDLLDSSSAALLYLQRNWLKQEPPVYRHTAQRTPAGANPYAT